MFNVLGLALIIAADFVVHTILRADRIARFLGARHILSLRDVTGILYLYVLIAGTLLLIASSGLKRNRPWGKWTGASASALLLFGFPVLTAIGAVGLYALFTKPRDPVPQQPAQPVPATTDFWAAKRSSKAQPFISGVGMFVAFQVLALLTLWAQHNGLPVWRPGWKWWLYLVVFLLIQTALHELGHAGMAWSLFFRVRVISIGPFTFWNNGYGYQFRFEWKRTLDASGYMGAVPVNEDSLYLKVVAVTAAGPLTSLATGLLLLLLFFALPGSGFEAWWWVIAFNAALAFCDALISLMPFGYSDGSMLYHLIRRTEPGMQLLNSSRIAMGQEQAEVCHRSGDFQKEVELRAEALESARACGAGNAMAIAASHQALGHAKLEAEDWLGAEAEFRACLQYEAECKLNPPVMANAWSGLQKACLERYWIAESQRVGAAAINVLTQRKQNRNRTGLAVTRAMLAQAQVRAGAYDAALTEIDEALAILPSQQDRMMVRTNLLQLQARAYFAKGMVDRGTASAQGAVMILKSKEIPESKRNLAFDELGEIGEALWEAGQSGVALDIWREVIGKLESGGAKITAAQYRIKMSAALRVLGKATEALYMLPDEEGLPAVAVRSLVAERGELLLASGHARPAMDEFRRLVELWEAEPGPPAPEIAAAEGLLARACLEAGETAQAETLARRAADVLGPWGHPDAASCWITAALAGRERSRAVFADAVAWIERHPLLGAAEKARRMAFEKARIARMGPIEGKASWETAQASVVVG
jgi:tetratricopeptide (TPR) repeat protein